MAEYELWESILTLCLVLSMLVVMAFEWAPPDMVMMGCLIIFIPFKIITLEEAVNGFNNTGMLTVAVLFVVAKAVETTGLIEYAQRVLTWRLGRWPTHAESVLRFYVPIAALSTFLNNTPIVAMMIPALLEYSRAANFAPSKLLIPLSYAAILGGTCSIIGTSTNLVVNSLAQQNIPGFKFGFFQIAEVGLPVAIAGGIFLATLGNKLLPDRQTSADVYKNPREYVIVASVVPGGKVEGKTIEKANMRHLPGLFLAQIERGGGDQPQEEATIIPAPGPETVLQGGDKLFFAGMVDSVGYLAQHDGLHLLTHEDSDGGNGVLLDLYRLPFRQTLVEVVLAKNSPLVRKSVRETGFRSEYEAAVIAVHRQGTHVPGTIGDIVLEPGDNLLLVASKNFAKKHARNEDFSLVAGVNSFYTAKRRLAPLAAITVIAMVVCASAADINMLTCALFAAAILLLIRAITPNEARASISLEVLITIAAAFGISKAMQNSGAAKLVADGIVAVVGGLGENGLVAAVYIVTALMTEVVTNNAAVTLMFPIVLEASNKEGYTFVKFVYTLMMAASASFMTPIGYQCNLMVWAPGGYKFTDYQRIGVPLQTVLGILSIVVICLIDKWWIFVIALLALTPIVYPVHRYQRRIRERQRVEKEGQGDAPLNERHVNLMQALESGGSKGALLMQHERGSEIEELELDVDAMELRKRQNAAPPAV